MSSTKRTLYKLDANGKLREWAVWIEPRTHLDVPFNKSSAYSCFAVIIRHGLDVGEKQFEQLPFPTMEEAKAEADSRYERQRDRRGYTDTIPVERPYRPMLAQVYTQAKRLPPMIVVQPKLDGLRCMAAKDWMMSRQGTFFKSVPHIQQALKYLPPEVILDGELYCHGKSFQHIVSMTKRDQEHDDYCDIEYHVFDIADEQTVFGHRLSCLEEFVASIQDSWEPFVNHKGQLVKCPVKLVKSTWTMDPNHTYLQSVLEDHIKQGYEGIMLRDPMTKYELNIRSYGLYKFKKKNEDWYKIVDVIPGTGRARLHGIAVCETEEGKRFKCALSFPDFIKIQFLNEKEKYIGKRLLIEFVDYTDDNLPKHGAGKNFK